jgi:hypothetical protein
MPVAAIAALCCCSDILHVADHVRQGMNVFHFKGRRFTDVTSYVRFIKEVTNNCSCDEDKDLFSLRFLTASYAPRLGVQACIELLRFCVLQKGYVPTSFLKLPAAKAIPVGEVHALMQLCMHERPPRCPSVCSAEGGDPAAQPPAPQAVLYLAQLPTAGDLSVQQLTDILQLNMQQEECPKWRVLSELLCLPAAQQIETATAQGLLLAALECESMDSINILCQQVPACAAAWKQLDGEQLAQHLDALLQKMSPGQFHHLSEFSALLNHPSLQEQVKQVIPQLLLSAFAGFSKSSGGDFQVCGAPASGKLLCTEPAGNAAAACSGQPVCCCAKAADAAQPAAHGRGLARRAGQASCSSPAAAGGCGSAAGAPLCCGQQQA